MRHPTSLGLVPALVLSMVLVSPAFGAGPAQSAASEPSHETREKMAEIHQKMAECLRSDRPFDACRTEMRTSCRQTLGANGCPMMEGGPGMHHRMMGGGKGRGMGAPSTQPAPAPEAPKQ